LTIDHFPPAMPPGARGLDLIARAPDLGPRALIPRMRALGLVGIRPILVGIRRVLVGIRLVLVGIRLVLSGRRRWVGKGGPPAPLA